MHTSEARIEDQQRSNPARTSVPSLSAGQDGVDLRFGAWIGGREPPCGSPLLKLELYSGCPPVTCTIWRRSCTSPATARHGPPSRPAWWTGWRLGVSIACTGDEPPEIALFVSARTLFPTGQEMLAELAPVAATVDHQRWRVGAVWGSDPTGRALPVAVDFYPQQRR